MNRITNDLSQSGIKLLRPFIFAVIVFAVVFIFTVLFSLIAVYTPVGMSFINIASAVIFYIGAFVTGVLSGRRALKNGWIKGLFGSALYFSILFAIGCVLNGDFIINFKAGFNPAFVLFIVHKTK